MQSDEKIRGLYDRLYAAHGGQGWWPAETPFEVCVGAILTQNTNWKNVEKAIANLKAALALTPSALWNVPEEHLAELIRPAGYFRLKAGRLRNFLRLIVEQYNGSLEHLFDLPTDDLRLAVLGVRGIGRETADSILLYAAERPVFVVDAYTLRIAFRHSLVDEDCDYDMLQETFTMALQRDVDLFKEFHALLVRAGKAHCKKREPACDLCPLATMLEDGEPREPF